MAKINQNPPKKARKKVENSPKLPEKISEILRKSQNSIKVLQRTQFLDAFYHAKWAKKPVVSTTPSIVYKGHAIRDTSQNSVKIKGQKLVQVKILRDKFSAGK